MTPRREKRQKWINTIRGRKKTAESYDILRYRQLLVLHMRAVSL